MKTSWDDWLKLVIVIIKAILSVAVVISFIHFCWSF